jgi:hypothetical protein
MASHVIAAPAVERVLSRLKQVKPAGTDRWMALCPSHDDKQRSLSIRAGKDGRVVMHCHAGCANPVIVAALGLSMSDLFADAAKPTNGVPPLVIVQKSQGMEARPRMVKSYDYTDAKGVLLFQACRFEPKGFRQRRPTPSGEWAWNLEGVIPVLYRLPGVIDAVANERQIFIVEGEKDADALADLGYPATTSPMGAGKWRETYGDVLSGAEVVILPDNDEVGRAHAEQIAASLYSRKAIVRVVALPDLPEKGDVSDWLSSNGDLDRLSELIGATPRWTPDRVNGKRTRWRLDELWENDSIMRPPPPIVPRLAWAGRSTLLAAREKSGKSTLTGYIAAQVTRGGRFLGDPCGSGDVLIIGLEEYLGDAARRLRHFGADATRIHLVDAFLGDPHARPQELGAHIDAVDPMLVIVDSLAAYSHGQAQDDNNASQMVSVVQPLTDLAHSRGVALVIVHHARKSDGRSRGSTAITAGTDVVCEFFCPDDSADPMLRRMRTIGRVPVQPAYDVRFDGDHYCLATGQDAPIEAKILGVVAERPGISINDVINAVGNRRDDVARAIHLMLATRALINLSDSTQRAKLAIPEAFGPGLAFS